MARTAAAKRTAYHHGNLRGVLVETGLRVIEKHGLGALTLREIGSQAGVSRTAAYRHFASKEELICAISEAGFAIFNRELAAAKAAAAEDFPNCLRAMGIAYVRFAVRHRARYAIMFDASVHAGGEQKEGEEASRAFAQLEDLIREGQQSGAVPGSDTTLIAKVVWAHVHGISTLGLSLNASGGVDEDFLHRAADLLLQGISRPTAPAPAPHKRKKP